MFINIQFKTAISRKQISIYFKKFGSNAHELKIVILSFALFEVMKNIVPICSVEKSACAILNTKFWILLPFQIMCKHLL